MKRPQRARKRAWEDFAACFERRRLGPLKHFTAPENLPSIMKPPRARGPGHARAEGGLYSRRRLAELGIAPHRLHGWGGKGKALQDFICLSFALPVGILRAEAEAPAVLLVDRMAILWEGTCFCRTNSASRNISAEEILASNDLAAFESLFRGGYGDRLRYRQAEVLVRDHVPLPAVDVIVLPHTPAGREAARRLRRIRWGRWMRGRWAFPQIRYGSWQSLL